MIRDPRFRSRAGDELEPPGELLYGPFVMNRREMAITERGLYGRASHGERIANTILAAVLVISSSIALIGSVASRDWGAALASAFVDVIAVVALMGVKPQPYRPILEIAEGRIVMGGRDCGPLEGACVQPHTRGTYAVALHTAAIPRGRYVLQLVRREDVGVLYGLLIRHLHLDGSRSGDWPPRPERNGNDASRNI